MLLRGDGEGQRIGEELTLLVEQLGMRSGPDKNDRSNPAAVVKFINQQEVAADMAFPMAVPFTFERMVEPFRT